MLATIETGIFHRVFPLTTTVVRINDCGCNFDLVSHMILSQPRQCFDTITVFLLIT